MRKLDACPCDNRVLAHEPDANAQVSARVKTASVVNVASKIIKIEIAFQIFQLPRFSGSYALSTLNGFIQKFDYRGRSGWRRFPQQVQAKGWRHLAATVLVGKS